MRITSEKKEATRRRIVDSAIALFRTRGFDATTTRDIARAASIATGTLFNYFDTKESLVASLAAEALAKARCKFISQTTEDASLEEELFGLVAAELRHLKPLRTFIAPILETVLSPLAAVRQSGDGEAFRIEHLELVAGIVHKHALAELSPVALQMYWALYTGVLAIWAADKSPKQEDTLALLDQSLNMFAAWMRESAGESR
jgi:AcrR family transcriptional regulator